MSDELIVKYRPQEFSYVLGQPVATRALQAILDTGSSSTVILSGPSGVGKTTLARIMAKAWGCDDHMLFEIDAATATGIDRMREVVEVVQHRPLIGAATVVLVDECHALSKAAWQSLLKIVEEPPDHLYWVFCTTDLAKVPKTIQTRCPIIRLTPVARDILRAFVSTVADEEGFALSEVVTDLCADYADGSPRQALANLVLCATCTGEDGHDKALMALHTVQERDVELGSLVKQLVGGTDWKSVVQVLRPFLDKDSESIRRVIVAYVTKMVLGADTRRVPRLLHVLDCFSEPYAASTGGYPLVLSAGRCVFGDASQDT